MRKRVAIFCVLFASSSMQAALSVTGAIEELRMQSPGVIARLEKEAPTVLPTLTHRHRPLIKKARQFFAGSGAGLVSLMLFGALHNQHTAHVSKEYFSEGFHKHNLKRGAPGLYKWLAKRDSSVLWGGAWGAIAGGPGMGIYVGPILAGLALIGNAPPVPLKKMLIPVLLSMAAAVSASIVGVRNPEAIEDLIGATSRRNVRFWKQNREHRKNNFDAYLAWYNGPSYHNVDVPMTSDQHRSYYRAANAHQALYAVGTVGIVLTALWTIGYRAYLARQHAKELPIAREILASVSRTSENEEALAVLEGAI